MIDVVKAASYIYSRYQEERNEVIDQMKLHKLLYLSQRESIIRIGEPMFSEKFAAWKYGPVIVKIRNLYKTGKLNNLPTDAELSPFKESFDYVFQNYAIESSWSLSLLTHGESSWRNARKGLKRDERCDNELELEDIRKDAERMKMRRFYFDEIAPQLNKLRNAQK